VHTALRVKQVQRITKKVRQVSGKAAAKGRHCSPCRGLQAGCNGWDSMDVIRKEQQKQGCVRVNWDVSTGTQ